MKYIYDILLNFTDRNSFYEYYEWKKEDNLVNVRKSPILKVSSKIINDFINYEIKLNNINTIINKSILYKKDISRINNVLIISNGNKSIGISFNKNGNVIYKSSMLIDEENEANIIIENMKCVSLNYIKKDKKKNNNTLRIDNIKRKEKIKEIKNNYKNKEFGKLKYLYYEIFNKESNNMEEIYNKLLKYNN